MKGRTVLLHMSCLTHLYLLSPRYAGIISPDAAQKEFGVHTGTMRTFGRSSDSWSAVYPAAVGIGKQGVVTLTPANIRRDIADTAVRGVLIEDRLRVLGVVEQSLNPAAQLRRAEQNLKEERRQLKISEGILQDVQRECKAPVIVPQLLMMVDLPQSDSKKLKKIKGQDVPSLGFT
ncbi:hypothetical protein B0H13DRAFT_1851246 [Mycena leptocephala]|nr:hypothetical protein B0H13DRAFT_1851246 [Mycena leptocephala]